MCESDWGDAGGDDRILPWKRRQAEFTPRLVDSRPELQEMHRSDHRHARPDWVVGEDTRGRHGHQEALLRGPVRAERDHSREVAEAALAHLVRNPVEAAYARSDLFERRRLLMDEWAAYVAGERESAG